MSYNIGQFRCPQLNSYFTPLEMDFGYQETTNVTSNDITFYNICGNLSGENIVNNQNAVISFYNLTAESLFDK